MSRFERPHRGGQRQAERRGTDRDSSVDRHGRHIVEKRRNESIPRSRSPEHHPARGSGQDLSRGSAATLATSPSENSYILQNDGRASRHGPGAVQGTGSLQGGQGNVSGRGHHSGQFQPGYYTDPRPAPPVSIAAPPLAQYLRPQPSASPTDPLPTQNQLSTLGHSFAAIGLAEYERCERFILRHSEITREPHINFLETAVRAIRDSRGIDAQRCIQQVLILRRCEENGREHFFDDLINREEETMASFRDDFHKIYETLKKRAFPQPTSVGQLDQVNRLRSSTTGDGQNQPRRRSIIALSGVTDAIDHISLTDTPPVGRHDEVTQFQAIPESAGRQSGDNTTKPGINRRDSNRGSTDNSQRLDSRYTKRESKFFCLGRVFAVIWHESNSAGDTAASDWSRYDSSAPYGQQVYSSPRRMVVVKKKHGSSWCSPVTTYNGWGLAKKGLSTSDIDAHAIIYMTGTDPTYQPGEPTSKKRAIAVIAAHADQKLDAKSRVNFSKIHTVEHNQRVMNVGKVTDASLPYLIGFFKEQFDDD